MKPIATAVTERFLTAMRHIIAYRVGGTDTTGDFAKAVGIHVQNISKMEPGSKVRRYAGIEHVVAMCETYGVDPDWLLFGKGEMFRQERSTHPDPMQVLNELEKTIKKLKWEVGLQSSEIRTG